MTSQEIGTLIRRTRIDQGLLQERLAAAAGVGVRFLVELERGKETAQLGRTLQVLRVLGCRVEITPPPPRPGDRS